MVTIISVGNQLFPYKLKLEIAYLKEMSSTSGHGVVYHNRNVIHKEVPQQNGLGGGVQLVSYAFH